jgi:hypothetical protein
VQAPTFVCGLVYIFPVWTKKDYVPVMEEADARSSTATERNRKQGDSSSGGNRHGRGSDI